MAAQQVPGITRTDLQQHDLSVPGREVVQNRVELASDAPAIPHTHPGEEVIYILEGSLEYRIGDEPPVTYSAGEALIVPAGVVHAVKTAGPDSGVELATYVVEKGKPLLGPAE